VINHPENHDTLISRTSSRGILTRPVPHTSAVFGKLRSTKTLLIRVLGCYNPTLEEISTVLCRIEATLNSRPLTPMSSSFHDLDYLFHGHFLIGQPLLAVPDLTVPDKKYKLTHRWKLLLQCFQTFWCRWSSDYLHALQVRTKWTTKIPNFLLGDMVIIKSSQGPPLTWRMECIVDVKPDDGIIRVARILTSQGELTRAVVILVLLPKD